MSNSRQVLNFTNNNDLVAIGKHSTLNLKFATTRAPRHIRRTIIISKTDKQSQTTARYINEFWKFISLINITKKDGLN